MFHMLKALVARSSATLAQDALGMGALVVLLFAGLSLPAGF
jgi:hypothetical protein